MRSLAGVELATKGKRMESKINKELQRLAKKYGGKLYPQQVVAEAKNKTSPLHNSFEWNDGEAAEQWRLHQARNLIRAQVIIIPGHSEPIRAFVSLTTDRKDNGGYIAIAKVMSEEDLMEQMIEDATNELQVFTKKFNMVKELSEVNEAAKKFLEQQRKSKKKIA